MPSGDQPETLASLRRKAPAARPTQPDLFAPEPSSPTPFHQPPEKRIYTVRALVSDIRFRTEAAYPDIWVEGEISNCRPAASGHIYFTLKDGEAQLPIVLFRRQAQLLRFRPQDGLAALVRGRVSVYESRGELQLIAETIEPRGAGALQLAFEQLKRRLADEGLFDSARKRPLPAFPQCIGIVTSPTGAVIRDIVTIVRRRHARLNLLVFPATMQGPDCARSVAAGIRWFNAHSERVDLILLARGGGSIEDLASFNDEHLARAIAASKLPIVSAVGHETDFTIADFVADLRAATPSAAAELVTAAQHRIEDRVHALAARLHRGVRFHLMQSRARYTALSADSVLTRLRDTFDRRQQRLDDLAFRAESSTHRCLRVSATRLASLSARLQQQAPNARLTLANRRLERSRDNLARTRANLIATRKARLDHLTTCLEALSPLAVLKRGYALIYSIEESPGAPHLDSEMWDSQPLSHPLSEEVLLQSAPRIDLGAWDVNIPPVWTQETLLRSAADIRPGQRIRARLASGSLTATVSSTQLETAPK